MNSLLCLFLFLLSISINGVLSSNSTKTSLCPSSSACGHLLNIHYPFRLKTDPPNCGSTDYELLCDSNKPYLEWESGRYYVRSISYTHQTINVVDPSFMDTSQTSCSVPKYPFQSDFVSENYIGSCNSLRMNVASFLNCTEKKQDQDYIPCMSGNGSYVYVTIKSSDVMDLQPSCRFLNDTYISYNYVIENSNAQVLDLLQEGFTLCWYRQSVKEVFGYCLKQASRYFFDQVINGKDMPSAPDFIIRQGSLLATYQSINVSLPLVTPLVRSEAYFLQCVGDNVEQMRDVNYVSQNTLTAVFDTTAIFLFVLQLFQLYLLLMIVRRFIFMPIVVCVFLAHKHRRSKEPVDYVEKFLRGQKALAPTRYSYTEIIAITRNFKEKLGEGGFGSVFKGTIMNHRFVAVKMLGDSKLHGDEEIINEVSTLGLIHHKNIVQLVGFCSEGAKKALVYEYMPNGSLEKHICSTEKNRHARPFTWEKLNEIALGVARGIDYLHRECDMQILHFDIKPHNILLDHNFGPKISDFGLAKLYPKDFSLVSLSIAKGTTGYVAPEVISRNFGAISHKSDVYSFGMMLLEMSSGKRNWNVPKGGNSASGAYYPSWIYDQLVQQETQEIYTEIEEMEAKLCKIGLWCIQMKQSDRPAMNKVVEMLEGDSSDRLPIPPRPFFSSSQPNHDDTSTSITLIGFETGTDSY
ncbi:hypothetical protein LUZ60_012782 [Juncus effusus]|nr:hypothetical protein LUZ60_012782 [Juncus effusus]